MLEPHLWQGEKERLAQMQTEARKAGVCPPSAQDTVYYAFADGQVRAFIAARYFADEAEILSVLSLERRQGNGRRLMQSLFDFLQEKGVQRVFLEVRASNESAQNFYHALGFQEIARRKNYYALVDGGAREDALIFAREL